MRSADLDAAKVCALLRRVIAVRTARHGLFERLEQILEQRGRPIQKGERDISRSRLRGEADLPVGIEAAAVRAAVSAAFGVSCRHQLEHVQRSAIKAQLEALGLVEDRNLVEARAGIACELHANAVDAIAWKRVPHQRAAARAERESLEAIVLLKFGRHEKRVRCSSPRRRADGHRADLLRCGEIPLHQRRRHPLHTGDVVEPVAHVICRQHRADVDIEREEIPYCVPIFRAVQPMQRFRAPGIGLRVGCAIERGLEVRDQVPRCPAIRPRTAGRRHQVGAELLDDLLPDSRMPARTGDTQRLERKPARFRALVVARHAVLRHECLPRRGRSRVLRRLLWVHRGGKRRSRDADQHRKQAPSHHL